LIGCCPCLTLSLLATLKSALLFTTEPNQLCLQK
jgi:hypothetical protein